MTLDEVVTEDGGVRRFVQWSMATLGVSLVEPDSDSSTYDIPEVHRSLFDGASVVKLIDDNAPSNDTPSDGVSRTRVDERFLSLLMERLHRESTVPTAVPQLAALRVHDISARLFDAYTVDGGTLHLSGCTLEDRPVLRQTWLDPGDAGPPRLQHRFTDAQGVTLSDSEITTLGLDFVQPPSGSLPKLVQDDVLTWCASARDRIAENGDAIPAGPTVLASVVWCQFAAGKIAFVIDDASAEVAFSGWARQLVAGQVGPPEFECPVTGIRSYAIAATDDGQITAREAIQVCAESGRRVLVNELVQCEQTGKAVLPSYLVTCPVTGERILESIRQPCETCLEAVSPSCLENGVCKACRTLIPIRKDDPRMARVFGEYPQLDRWRNWRIGETSTSYVLVAAALIKRILIVVNKESLELMRLATRSRFSSQWADPPPTERQELLR